MTEENYKIHYRHYWIEKPSQPNVIVVTIYDRATGKIGRGMSVKSPKDQYDILTGEEKAKNYALRAIKGRDDKLVTDPRAIGVLIKTGCPWVKHSDKNPVLTFEERRRLFGLNFGQLNQKRNIINKIKNRLICRMRHGNGSLVKVLDRNFLR